MASAVLIPELHHRRLLSGYLVCPYPTVPRRRPRGALRTHHFNFTPLPLQSTPELLERFHERFTFTVAEARKQFGNLLFVFRTSGGELGHDFVRGFNDGCPAIRRVPFADDQSVLLERIDEGRHVRRGHAQLLFELTHDPRAALMNRP